MYNNSIPSVVSPRQFICSSPLANSAVLSALLSTYCSLSTPGYPVPVLPVPGYLFLVLPAPGYFVLVLPDPGYLVLVLPDPGYLVLVLPVPRYPVLVLSAALSSSRSVLAASRRSITLGSSHPVQPSLWTAEPAAADG